jgi:methionyl-tRNA formyltransferase
MRFAITAVDRTLGVFEDLLASGWRPVKLFTVPPDASGSLNRMTIEKAMRLDIPVQVSPMRDGDLKDLADRDCEVLVTAAYSWRIGDWRRFIPHAVNFHASPLPLGRGPHPAVRAILEGRREWGVSCHKIDRGLDTGDVLDQEAMSLSGDECHESLALKTQMAFSRLTRRVAGNFPALWAGARPQAGGAYWPYWTPQERTLDYAQPVETLMRQVRAFGLIETLAALSGGLVQVRRAVGWTEDHAHPPGTVVSPPCSPPVVAVRDGYLGLIEWSPLPGEAAPVPARATAAPVAAAGARTR